MESDDFDNCEHKNWRCSGDAIVGYVKCIDCGNCCALGMDVAFERLRQELQDEIDKVRRLTSR